ncbi:MAG: hypothetical protein JNL01_08710 [Bdellovibrionales bacterium]|nr:hypothetical protein [Bdellovibrionales bacterium]
MSVLLSLGILVSPVYAQTSLKIIDATNQKPLNQVMVTLTTQEPNLTRFSNSSGLVSFPEAKPSDQFRIRLLGYKDQTTNEKAIQLQPETDPVQLAMQLPANVWLGNLNLGSAETFTHFKMQCAFCHQQGNVFTRIPRTAENWTPIIKRMVRYGSRLPSEYQKSLPELLEKEWTRLSQNPPKMPPVKDYGLNLSKVKVTDWKIGDAYSQTHDILFTKGVLYVADNIQDRFYVVNPETNQIQGFDVPHREGEKNGGLIAGRLKDFPKHNSTSNLHSLAESQVDGHIFFTPSAQRRIIEFDPKTKGFTLHEMDDGFYPHTIRLDSSDRVWFTLALSNQIGMMDRKNGNKFTLYDLPTRSFKEKMTNRLMPYLFKLMSWGLPISNWVNVDKQASGTPLPYGIDITPDQKVWFARLHTQEIGRIDPQSGEIKLYKTPFMGPRRLRTDSRGHLWITSYGESKIGRFDPKTEKFDVFDLPVYPLGSETPYALNVDRKNDIVWVTGNQSDSLYGLDIRTQKWMTVPLTRRTTFTRDIEFDEKGNLYTANSNFPAWHVEGGGPTTFKVEIENAR